MNRFQSILGQDQAIALLHQAIAQKRIAPAYLLVGPDGVGKSLAAKAFGETLLMGWGSEPDRQERFFAGNHPDLLKIEPTFQHQGKLLTAYEAEQAGLKRRAAPLIRVEQIREINRFLSRPPLEADRAVILIEEAQAMNEGAANALLKTLEEPGRATLILLAPSVDALLPTIVSRCQRIPFYRLEEDDMAKILQRLGRQEILNHPELLAIAQGSPGILFEAWEQMQSISAELRQKLIHPPVDPLAAFDLAKLVDSNLDNGAQLWLVDYLQYHYWQSYGQRQWLEILEKARKYLTAYVQPRLVWESTFLTLYRLENHGDRQ
ncbi:AAA family ATPase [Synechocystis sp. PCC 7339]|uniref:DNA polymerase III subunit delta' n=1 Tax=unclassified Synechocystis TaxID=2640012 RepID=UPI001BAFF5A2|nr:MULTISPECIES: DNA polymerase III subunit delta' [unclassified Synechocystis]QUS60789.1 AAA family ATPase [Synechocystis sp. PCC 7338]UAJ72979.1 AAA family ATPase [Synechocystis sp. PCC 7339]